MNHDEDRRLKDLIDRLVAMAPEPPEFPEEVALTTEPTPQRPRPILVLAGAMLLVLLGAAIPILLTGADEETPVATEESTTTTLHDGPATTVAEATSTTTDGETSTTEGVTTTAGETTTTEPLTDAPEGTVYAVQDPANSFLGNPALIPLLTEIEGEEDTALEALRVLASEPDLPESTYNAVPDDVEFLSASREGATLSIEANEAFRAGAGGLLADMTMLNQLVFTATQSDEIDTVVFTIDNQPIVDFGSDGLDISEGLTRETFLDSLNIVLVLAPVDLESRPLEVRGMANVFEATVSLEVVDPEGQTVYQDFTTATCGTGCWGDYVFDLGDVPLEEGSVVRVFWNSPEDGEPSNVVSIPIGDGPWQLES